MSSCSWIEVINPKNMLEELKNWLLSTFATTAVLYFLIRSLLTHWLAKDIDAHKAKLQRESETGLENMRAAIKRLETEHQVKFSQLQTKRFDVLESIHSRLVEIFLAVEKLVTMHQGPEFHDVRHKNAQKALRLAKEFCLAFEKQRIYVSEDLAKKIDEFVLKLAQTSTVFSVEMDLAVSPGV